MKLYKRGKYYYFKPCINGKQRWVNTHEENHYKARIYAENYIVKQRQDKFVEGDILLSILD